MKYPSIFVAILMVWIAVILMAITRSDSEEVFQLYLAVTAYTVALFLIGFARK